MFSGTLSDAMIRVLEDSFFLSPTDMRPCESDMDPAQDWTGQTEGCVISVIESDNALVTLWVPKTLAGIMASNMTGTGISDSDPEEGMRDAAGESANMVAGLVMGCLRSGSTPKMGTPTLCDAAALKKMIAVRSQSLVAAVELTVEELGVKAALFEGKAIGRDND